MCGSYAGNGYYIARGLLGQRDLAQVATEIESHPTFRSRLGSSKAATEPYLRAFDRVMNLWRLLPAVRALLQSQAVTDLVRECLECERLRLSHDQCLYKLPQTGATPIHADQYHWPIESEKILTVWIPLHAVPVEMGALAFFRGSHLLDDAARQLLSRSEEAAERHFRSSDCPFPRDEFSFAAGDVSVHSGWTFHEAPMNNTVHPRKILTGIYMADGVRIVKTRADFPEAMLTHWCPGATFGDAVASPLNPLLEPRSADALDQAVKRETRG